MCFCSFFWWILFRESELVLLLIFCKTGGFGAVIFGDTKGLIRSLTTSFLITTGANFMVVFCFFIGDKDF